VLRDWLTDSDEWLSPQAAVLSPVATCRIAEKIVGTSGKLARTVAAGLEAVALLREGIDAGRLRLSVKEQRWLDRLGAELARLPDEEALFEEVSAQHGGLFDRSSYGFA
jgi:methanol--5-hydroxybenzimidazolylcobamide Co-methyltransferase